ncbi:MAG: hypothetical protein ABL897_04240 [Hyphomicrobium sp.]
MFATQKSPSFAGALAGIAFTIALLTGVLSAHAEEAWEKLLQLQLEDSKKCVLSGTIFVREMPSAEGIIYSGRAKCFDGRQFDFSQSKPHMKFDIKACEPTVC